MNRSGRDGSEEQRQQQQRRRDRRILIIAAAVVLLLVVGGGVGYQVWQVNRAPGAVPERAEALAPQPVAAGKPVRIGTPDAPRTLTAYVDFHCPGCAGFEDDYGPALFDAAARGAVAIDVYPMSFHDAGSTAAANAFGCATEAGFGRAYYRGLFANRDLDWSDSQLTALAAAVTNEVPPTFAGCVGSRAEAGWVDSINAAAEAAGVQQTPTVFLDGDPVDLTGTTPDMLIAMIEKAPAR
ncbi:DsbA family protein [Microlunatus speluncae]|uniref:DsbA family protein n=1 Tax=Microlunatus speluncae TaxID=2594267 RepID=UPI00126668A2|nr:thioredoxin domain-containing protein [Microlunatus speluncae]